MHPKYAESTRNMDGNNFVMIHRQRISMFIVYVFGSLFSHRSLTLPDWTRLIVSAGVVDALATFAEKSRLNYKNKYNRRYSMNRHGKQKTARYI